MLSTMGAAEALVLADELSELEALVLVELAPEEHPLTTRANSAPKQLRDVKNFVRVLRM
ncbi:hypothetical protein HMPREF1324_0616 [Rothia aeria F0474]|uniref:Uncharacterized protein n=1 Tax=Rothia aeria F0474 TaxID=1125724 RepID=I0UT12_9MICC|nr:hypothetical protein HMPREF1324_0616 [Rothia aeria F0474]